MKQLKLNNGLCIPVIGFGTWQLTPDSIAEKAVSLAIKKGYRLIDTAKIYGNERGVGWAIRACGLPRSELFITTKLWNSDQGYDLALEACTQSLDRLGLDYVDLYLIHWPASSHRLESYRALIELYKQGRVRAIGVSNYTVRHLNEVLDHFDVPPAVNQIELHPFIYKQQKQVIDFCREQSIVVEAYSPLAQADRLDDPRLKRLAEDEDCTPAQLMLAWAIAKKTVPIPRSSDPERMGENIASAGIKISDRTMSSLDALSMGGKTAKDQLLVD